MLEISVGALRDGGGVLNVVFGSIMTGLVPADGRYCASTYSSVDDSVTRWFFYKAKKTRTGHAVHTTVTQNTYQYISNTSSPCRIS